MVLFRVLDDSPPLFPGDPRIKSVPGESVFPLEEGHDPDDGYDGRPREPHAHPDMLQIILATSGACICEIDGMQLAARAPSLITIPGGGVHGFKTDGASAGWAATIPHFRVIDLVVNRNLDHGFLLRRAYAVAPSADDNEVATLEQLLRTLHEEANRLRDGWSVAKEALQQLIVIHAARMIRAGHDQIGGEVHGERELFLAFRAMIEQRYLTERRVGEYVTALRCSQTRLSRACMRFAGQSAKGVILDRLVEEAQRRLLFTRASASKIGYALGFVEPSYFLRFFRKRTGMTPTEYRAQQR